MMKYINDDVYKCINDENFVSCSSSFVFFLSRLLQRQPGSGLCSPGHCWLHHAKGWERPLWLEQHLPHHWRQRRHHGTSSCVAFFARWPFGVDATRAWLIHLRFLVAMEINSTQWECFVLFNFFLLFFFKEKSTTVFWTFFSATAHFFLHWNKNLMANPQSNITNSA